jgi:hypothetical protein
MRGTCGWGGLLPKSTETIMYKKATAAAFGLAIANFAYQAATFGNWALASDRSFFQALAILLFVISLKVGEKS